MAAKIYVRYSNFSCLPERMRNLISLDSDDEAAACWLWTGYCHPIHGPRVSYGGTTRQARRVIFELITNRPIHKTEPLLICPENPFCVNPRHTRYGMTRNLTPDTQATFTQAEHICKLFGGEHAMAKLLGVAPSTCYRWSYPPPKGTDGIIPHRYLAKIKAAARFHGVLLSDADWALKQNKVPA